MDVSKHSARGLVLRSALAACACFVHATASYAAADDLEEIVVTGSRIARASDFESPSPVITLGRESIEKSGYNNLQQLLEKLPANGQGMFSTRGNNQDSSANGASSISLRGLGADSTLVLVNGRRVAISSFAESVTTNFVDINTIPVGAIERVEVLTDGSSAVYGSDAVAGVVNVILRKDFQGFETSASYGSVTEGSYEELAVSALWGTGDEDTNVTLVFDYFSNTSLFNRERGRMGTADQSARGGHDNRSSRGFPGSYTLGLSDAQPIIVPDPSCSPANVSDGVCLYDYGPWNVLIPEAERTGLLMTAHQDVGAAFTVFTEIAVQHNTSFAQGAPTPLDDGAGLTVPLSHPDNPFTDANVESIDIFRYRPVDAGPRQFDIESDNLRGVLGMRGTVADWDWEVAAQRARSESEQTGDRSQGWVRTDFLQREIDAGRYNPFGGVQNPQEVIDAITTSLVRRGKSRLNTYDGQVSGEVFKLPAGMVQMAAGLEYREESISDIPDDQFQRGLIFGTEAVSAAAARDSWATFVEFSVPVLENLELSLAGRYDDYSDFGDTTNPKLAVRYEPIDSLAFRGSWGKGFRAPSLAQVGLGPSQSSLFFQDTYGCAVNNTYCASTDYNLVYSGNPDLKPEKSENYNLGVAFKPTDELHLSLDYWNIEQKDKIDTVPFQYIYQVFCNDQNSTVCVRGEPLPGEALGPLRTIAVSFQNITKQKVNGLDLAGFYSMALPVGRLSLNATFSRLLKFERLELVNRGTDDEVDLAFLTRKLAGEYEFPKNRAVLSADLASDMWGAYLAVNHVGSFQDTPQADFNADTGFRNVDTRHVGDFTTLNLQVRYTGFDSLKLLFSVDNVLNELPPFAIGDDDNDLYGYVQNLHNPRGRFWNAKAIYSF